MSAKITSINFSWKDNYVNFNDTDCQFDYFHGYILNQKETAQWIKESGADCIRVTVTNNDKEIPALRRVKQICKKAGYTFDDCSHVHKFHGFGTPYEAYVIEYELQKIKEPEPEIFNVWIDPKSTCLERVLYMPEHKVLNVKFHSGPQIYSYFGVSIIEYGLLMTAPSRGKFFLRYIKPSHSVNAEYFK